MNFQPPDPPEPDYDTLAEEMFDRYEKCGYAVISRDEWRAKLDDAAKDGYAEGRKDEREEWAAVLESLRDVTSKLEWFIGDADAHCMAATQQARAAIAKATGEQP